MGGVLINMYILIGSFVFNNLSLTTYKWHNIQINLGANQHNHFMNTLFVTILTVFHSVPVFWWFFNFYGKRSKK